MQMENERIKVLMIVKALQKTGVTSVMMTYSNHINRQKFQLDILTGSIFDDEIRHKFEEQGCKFHVINERDKNIVKYIKNLAHIIKSEKYDIVHVHGNSAMIFPELLAATIGGVKVRIAHSHNTKCNHPLLEKLVRPIFHLTYTNAIACSDEAGKWLLKKDYTIINNGIDIAKFAFSAEKRNEIRKELNLTDELLIGHVGYFNYQKNHEKIIAVFSEIKRIEDKAKLILVGNGENRANIENLVKEMNLSDSVIFYGESDDVAKLMCGMDVFLFPSHFEGFGIVLVEAQATGLKCFASTEVPKRTNVANAVDYISLQVSDLQWAQMILRGANEFTCSEISRENQSRIQCALIHKSGYDYNAVVSKLESFYDESFM